MSICNRCHLYSSSTAREANLKPTLKSTSGDCHVCCSHLFCPSTAMPPKGKQGTKGSKQIAEENQATLKFYRNIILVANAIFFLVYFYFWEQFTTLPILMLIVTLAICIGSYQFMASMGRATYSQGVMVDSGIDLNMEAGMAEHCKDIILLACIVQACSLISNYFWLFLLLAPGRAFYLLWVNFLGPWFFAEAPEQPVDDKKARKMERKMRRQQH